MNRRPRVPTASRHHLILRSACAGLAVLLLAGGCASRGTDLTQRDVAEIGAFDESSAPFEAEMAVGPGGYEKDFAEGGGPAAAPAQEQGRAADAAVDSAVELVAAQTERKLIFTARLSVRVEDTLAAVEDVRRFVEQRGGFVESSRLSDERDGLFGHLVLRVPREAYEDTLAHLRDLAVEVLRDESDRLDKTQQYADLQARLTNLEAAEAELREILSAVRESGGTAEDVIAVHRELTSVRGQIDSLRAQRDALAESVALSTINVDFRPVPKNPAEVVDRWRPGLVFRRAASDLASSLRNITDGAIYFGVAILPVLSILAGVVWFVVWVILTLRRALRRRKTA